MYRCVASAATSATFFSQETYCCLSKVVVAKWVKLAKL